MLAPGNIRGRGWEDAEADMDHASIEEAKANANPPHIRNRRLNSERLRITLHEDLLGYSRLPSPIMQTYDQQPQFLIGILIFDVVIAMRLGTVQDSALRRIGDGRGIMLPTKVLSVGKPYITLTVSLSICIRGIERSPIEELIDASVREHPLLDERE